MKLLKIAIEKLPKLEAWISMDRPVEIADDDAYSDLDRLKTTP